MKYRKILISSLVLFVVLFSACNKMKNPSTQPPEVETIIDIFPAQTENMFQSKVTTGSDSNVETIDMMTPALGVETAYKSLPNIAEDKAQQDEVLLNDTSSEQGVGYMPQLVGTSDGGYLLTTSTNTYAEDGNLKTTLPAISKMNAQGRLEWRETYPNWIVQGMINHLVVASDDSYYMTFQEYGAYGTDTVPKTILMHCAPTGEILWHQEYIQQGYDAIGQLFVTSDDLVFTGGLVFGENDQTNSQLQLLHPEDGHTVFSAKLEGAFLYNALETDSGKIVVTGNKEQNFYAWIFSPELKLEQQVTLDNCYGYMVTKNNFIYLIQTNYLQLTSTKTTDPNESLYTTTQRLTCLTDQGDIKWEYSFDQGAVDKGITVLSDDSVILGMQLDYNKGQLAKINSEGQLLWTKEVPYAPSTLDATSDDGFIAVATRIIKTVPQPAYVSSIWFDTERLVVRYDKQGEILWQMTYDAYKDVLGNDVGWIIRDKNIRCEGY